MTDSNISWREIPMPENGEESYFFKDFYADFYSGRNQNYSDRDFYRETGKLVVTFFDGTLELKIFNDVAQTREKVPTFRIASAKAFLDEENTLIKSYEGFSTESAVPEEFTFQICKDYARLIKKFFVIQFFDFTGRYDQNKTRLGSGFAVNPNTVVTCQHIVNENKRLFAAGNDLDGCVPLELIYVDYYLDIAILKSKRRLKACALDRSVYDLGEDVFAYGYPQIKTQGHSLKAAKGIISAIKGPEEEAKSYQVDIAFQPGSSGGPLARDGKVVGIVTCSTDDQIPRGYAIKSNFLAAILDSLKIPSTGTLPAKDATYTILSLDEKSVQ